MNKAESTFIEYVMSFDADSAIREYEKNAHKICLSQYDMGVIVKYSVRLNSPALYKVSLDMIIDQGGTEDPTWGTTIEKAALDLGAGSVREMRKHGIEFYRCFKEAVNKIEITYYEIPPKFFLEDVFYESRNNAKLLNWLIIETKEGRWIPENYNEKKMVDMFSSANDISLKSSKDVLDFMTLQYVHLM